jgi:hypothetical protein
MWRRWGGWYSEESDVVNRLNWRWEQEHFGKCERSCPLLPLGWTQPVATWDHLRCHRLDPVFFLQVARTWIQNHKGIMGGKAESDNRAPFIPMSFGDMPCRYHFAGWYHRAYVNGRDWLNLNSHAHTYLFFKLIFSWIKGLLHCFRMDIPASTVASIVSLWASVKLLSQVCSLLFVGGGGGMLEKKCSKRFFDP